MSNHLHVLAEKIWQYHLMNHDLFQADVILVLCSHDTRVAERGAQLFHDGWAPLLIFSGGLGTITKDLWTEPEADQFAKVAIGMGVPKDKILIEKSRRFLNTSGAMSVNGMVFISITRPSV